MDYAVTYEELTDFIAKKKEEIANIWTERAVFIRSEYEFTEPVAHIVFNAAYERGHSCGYEEVIHYAREYAEFTERLFTAMDLR